MNRQLKKVIAGIMAVTMVCASSSMPSDLHVGDIICFGIEAYAETVANGECGDNLTWVLDDSGTLTVSGEGTMQTYGGSIIHVDSNLGAWRSYTSKIKSVIIEDGVKNISKQAFDECRNLTSITIPNSVTSIGNSAFSKTKLNHIHIPSGKDISDYSGKYGLPTDVSRYIVVDKYGHCTKADCPFGMSAAVPEVTAPEAVSDLTYTGEAQALITAGSTTAGTMEYSLDGVNYSTDIPTATDAGTYTVYYKVIGNENYCDVAAKSITVTIENVSEVISYVSVGKDNVTVSYTYEGTNRISRTETVAFSEVTVEMVDWMVDYDIELVIEFVNAFSATDDDCIMLTPAQMKAVEYVL